ncbi:DUF3604 domain-containing protein [Microbulbifer hainanensis]|uniref:DUF3604 domain-containing protein n=1 Tax=Microbulbifer hainanensis TaxID=2735675 RepID=UPI001866E65C|nr:DUF3604 domain-containing protein [Microbulbifer hainanensis]
MPSLKMLLLGGAVSLLCACGPDRAERTAKNGAEEGKVAAPASEMRAEQSRSATSADTSGLKNVYFGELHLHTAYSLDAYIGGMALMPEDAMRFAKGETIQVNGQGYKIHKPLDFFAITDHAEFIGEMYTVLHDDAPGHDTESVQQLLSLDNIKDREKWFLENVAMANRKKPQHASFFVGNESTANGWKEIMSAVERYNDPGNFTTIPAYEWTATPGGANLHRNIYFRDMNLPQRPMSYIDLQTEEELWQWMEELRGKGMQVFAIPHNSNASRGRMFPALDSGGKPLSETYAKMRNTMEPAIEIMQAKGDSEVHIKFWPNDEFADFENANSIQDFSNRRFSKRDFVREGLKYGLEYEDKLGVNPFKYGIVGGSDNHNGRPGNVWESNYHGGHGASDDTAEARRTGKIPDWMKTIDANPGAITGVWAPENTRAAIWDAIYNRETFATSGPRIKVRLFGGFGLSKKPGDYEGLVRTGYDAGVPMGGTLTPPPGNGKKGPTFYLYALKDPDGANLDRIQMVKGWVDGNGQHHEHIYDVAVSKGRSISAQGRAEQEVGNTVNAQRALYENTIGSTSLTAVWTDSAFDPLHRAYYYLRAIQIPTPRWSTYDAARKNLPLLDGVPTSIQERAWSSPIWYEPGQ